MTLLDRQKDVTNYLVTGFPELGLRGWALAGACAVTGNYTQENLCSAITVGRLDHGSQGLAQWRLGRLDELQAWSEKHFSKDGGWKSTKAQCAFTLFETARDYPSLDMELRASMEGVKAGDIRSVLDYKTNRFMREFERPLLGPTDGLANRQKHAASVYMIMSGGKLPVVPPKPIAPPIVTGSVGAGAAGSAIGGTVIAVTNNDVTDPVSLMLLGLAMVLAIVVIFLMRPAKASIPKVAATIDKQSPLDRLTVALEQRAIANAEVAEAADALKDSVQASTDLLTAASDSFLTIEHQPIVPVIQVLGDPAQKPIE